MLQHLTHLLNGALGPDLLRAMKVVFLALLALASLAVVFTPPIKPGKTSGVNRGALLSDYVATSGLYQARVRAVYASL